MAAGRRFEHEDGPMNRPLPLSVAADQPRWQCVLICWGTRYPTASINNLIRHIAAQARTTPRFVLIADADKHDLIPGVRTVRFPDYWLQAALRGPGCQAKLVMFDHGVLDDDLPAVYVDLDTIILGDLEQALELMTSPRTVALLQSAIVPFGPLGRWLHRISHGRHYARGNSSLVVFHPAHNRYIAERFRAIHDQDPAFQVRPTIADERFISWVAQAHARAIPADFAVKFPSEYMFPIAGWLGIRARLPWVRRRRQRQVAVTLCGINIKPDSLIALPDGARLRDHKGRVLIWGSGTLGAIKQRITDFYAGVYSPEGQDR